MTGELITEARTANLPQPVQRYLEFAGVVGKPWIKTALVKQRGRFRLEAEKSWMDFSAEQFYTISPPGFRWDANFKIAGLALLRAKDRYEEGHGHMYGRLAGLKTIFDARGPELDQASMLRYLNEAMWFPTAYLGENMGWDAVDDYSARVTFFDRGREVSAQLYFDGEGRLLDFKAKRYREADGEFSLDGWSTPVTAYGEFEGLKIPVSGTGIWNLPEGDFAYIELEITGIDYVWMD